MSERIRRCLTAAVAICATGCGGPAARDAGPLDADGAGDTAEVADAPDAPDAGVQDAGDLAELVEVPDGCAPSAEICNAVDDDCDGRVDEAPEAASSCALLNATSACSGGRCAIETCDPLFGDCNRDPADGCETALRLLTDCGACGAACARAHGTATCVSGTCRPIGCDAGWADCDAGAANGCEVPLGTPADCAACGDACRFPRATSACSGGTCTLGGCEPGWANCDAEPTNGCETSLTTTVDCGGCARGCGVANGTATCATGRCGVASCDPSWGDCDVDASTGCETPLGTATDCAGCGAICPATEPACQAGGCVAICSPPLTDCGGACVDTQSNDANCGACGAPCVRANASASCVVGACLLGACTAGFADCDGDPTNGCEIDLSSSDRNCGSCRTSCDAAERCAGGSCRTGSGALAIGWNHGCVVRPSGDIACWGRNDYGQFGNGSTADAALPVAAMMGIGDAMAASEGHFTGCAVRSSGEVDCAGRNAEGEMGDGTTTRRLIPVAVAGIADAAQVAVGNWHACALRATGEVSCWGSGLSGQLGNGTTPAAQTTPVAVTGVVGAVQIAAGFSHTCVLYPTGAVACWGRNASGQLGDGSLTDRSTPVAVAGLTDAVSVGTGDSHSCAVRRDGTVRCWGYNFYGQLGSGSASTLSASPVAVVGLADAVQISGGARSTCALRASGSLACWGANDFGQLGDGTTTPSRVPVTVSGLADAVVVDCGQDHACVARAAGGVACWGRNSMGQLGDGSYVDSPIPVAVVGLP